MFRGKRCSKLTVVVLLAFVFVAFVSSIVSAERKHADPFPNWLGEVDLKLEDGNQDEDGSETGRGGGASVATDENQQQGGSSLKRPEDVAPPSGQITKRLMSWKPRMFTLDGVLSQEETEYVLALAKENLDSFDVAPAMYNPTGIVTSWSISFYKNIVLYNIAKRFSTIGMVALENFADIEIFRFGDSYSHLEHHSDLLTGLPPEKAGRFIGERSTKGPGQRLLRFFVNLDPEDHKFAFGNANPLDNSIKNAGKDCTGSVVIQLKQTQSLMLHVMDTKGDPEEFASQYKTCPKGEGDTSFHADVSWLMVVTIHAYSTETCYDDDSQCAGWAAAGECDANPGFMLEQCRKSCDKC